MQNAENSSIHGNKVVCRLVSNCEKPYYNATLPDGNVFKISKESIEKLKRVKDSRLNYDFIPSWHMIGDYVGCSVPRLNKKRELYLHRYLMDKHNYSDKLSVDHINQDRLDNRLENLRVVDQRQQNHNKKTSTPKIEQVIEGFDKKIKLPDYIRYVKAYPNEKIKHSPHFIIESKYFKCNMKTNKKKGTSIKDKLKEAICLRYNAVINSGIPHNKWYIDDKHYKSKDEFHLHSIKLIEELCGEKISHIPFMKTSNMKDKNIESDKVDPRYAFPEKASFTKDQLPQYVSYKKIKGNCGSKLTYDRRIEKSDKTIDRIQFSSSGSSSVSLDDKLIDLLDKMKTNNIEIVWKNKKPTFLTQANNVKKSSSLSHGDKLFNDCLQKIKSRIEKKGSSQEDLKYNELDVKIIKQLNEEIKNLNRVVSGQILNISDDSVRAIINDKYRKDMKLDQITEEHLTRDNYINFYNEIKKEIISTDAVNKALKNQITSETNSNMDSWKASPSVVVEMLKLKCKSSHPEIIEYVLTNHCIELNKSDVQNMLTNNSRYRIPESWFDKHPESGMTFKEYTRLKDTNSDKLQAEYFKKHPDEKKKKERKKKADKSETDSLMSKEVMVGISKLRISNYSAEDIAKKFKRPDGSPITKSQVNGIWKPKGPLIPKDYFSNDSEYQTYLDDLKKTRPNPKAFKDQKRLDDLLEEIKNGKTSIKRGQKDLIIRLKGQDYFDQIFKDYLLEMSY